ncbi:MAG: bifunctional folylpolyglutamate synthase/dihydrofolate synthase [Planctomycetes bacterium]|nr:bifunctional folylpolyglutamate synthase/dihydrofolate synthase [Planctomycetota bacterium]
MDTYTLPSYGEVIQLLDTYDNSEINPGASRSYEDGIDRMARLMERLDNPHASIPAIHVAGTKGKGSTSHLAAAALAAAGIRTGLYTSPHVETPRERIVVNGRPIGEQRFVEAAMAVLKEADAMRDDGDAPSWFEIMTAIAFVAFRDSRAEAMVLETGMGGRLDATHLSDIRVIAAGLTSISLDHEAILGDSVEKIAAEKLEIIRTGVPVVCAPQTPDVMRLVREKARERHAPLFVIGKDLTVGFRKRPVKEKPGAGQRLDIETWRNFYPDVPLALLGDHQAANAGVALGLADLFLEYMDREPMDSMVLKRAWRNLTLPARMEVIGSDPWLLVDGAHNPASAWAAAETIAEVFPAGKRTLIFGVSSDKNYQLMLRILLPLFDQIGFAPFESKRSLDPAKLAEWAKKEFPELKSSVALDASHALEMAREFSGREGLVFACGSFYLAGEVRACARKQPAKA